MILHVAVAVAISVDAAVSVAIVTIFMEKKRLCLLNEMKRFNLELEHVVFKRRNSERETSTGRSPKKVCTLLVRNNYTTKYLLSRYISTQGM